MFNIAINTFKEFSRNKILYLIVFFGILLILFSLVLASLSLWQTEKIIIDFGISMIEILWIICVIFVWWQILFKEIEWKTIYLILTKPVSRSYFILGKFFWFAMILALIVILETIILIWLFIYSQISISFLIFFSIIFIYFKLLILFAIILFLSTFISSILSIILTLFIFIISHSITEIIDIAIRNNNQILIYLWNILYVIFPNFEALNIKSNILSYGNISNLYLLGNSLYAILYLCIMLFLTIIIFNKKTFEN
jgi:Cu-processing system permease protein